MKIVKSKLGPWHCWQVDKWHEAGLFHGFVGADLDVACGSNDWCRVLNDSPNLLLLKQVHGTDIFRLFSEATLEDLRAKNQAVSAVPCADAWLTSSTFLKTANCCAGIKTADCFPVLLRSQDGSFLGAAHCGWRGAVSGLLPRLIGEMQRLGVAPDRLEIAIGPGAQECCYTVGAEVEEALRKALPGAAFAQEKNSEVNVRRGGFIYASIRVLLEQQALGSGVPTHQVVALPLCTICDTSFFSYRRQKSLAGRQLSFIGAYSKSREATKI